MSEDWADKVPDLMSQIGIVLETASTIARLAILEQRLKAIEDKQSSPICIFISTLAVSDVLVVKPIPVTITLDCDDACVASFVDAGVSSGGDSLKSAVWSLQDMLASSYRMLAPMNDKTLGPKMRREKAVLLEFLCQSSPKPTRKTPKKS